MKTTLRMFALLVAVAGLGAAAFVPASTHAQPGHTSVLVSSPIIAAVPIPCPQTCVAGPNAVSDR